jgi:hypothetical protein
MRIAMVWLGAAAALGLVGCKHNDFESCDNGLDDDGNGDVDCDDSQCALAAACEPAEDETDCSDGADDDRDGLTDCDDPDCAAAGDCVVVEDCGNGADDDGDGDADCDDSDCAGELACQPPDEDCTNGLDDDEDGDVDCDDSDCASRPACATSPEVCDDGDDNDGDGDTDCDDSDCAGDPACATAAEDCRNQLDDDGDGDIDCDDSDCATRPVCATAEICDNTTDDDGDGDIDCDDRDCRNDPACATGALLVPYYIGAGGEFGYDATADEVTSVFVDGTEVPPTVDITVASQDYFTAFDPQYACTIELTYTGTQAIGLTSWSFTYDGTAYLQAGFVMPASQYAVTTDCDAANGKELDTTVLGTTDDIAASGWGVTVGTFNPDVSDAIVAQLGTTDPYVGGGFYWDVIAQQASLGLPDGVTPFDYADPIAVDGSYNLLNSSGSVATAADVANGDFELIAPADVMNANNIPPTGAYYVFNLSGWTFGP